MTVEAPQFIAPLTMPAAPTGNLAVSAPTGQFAAWFTEQLHQVNDQLVVADNGLKQLAAGNATSLHQVMIDLEQAKLSMQLAIQVRNHLLDAYHELLQMQV